MGINNRAVRKRLAFSAGRFLPVAVYIGSVCAALCAIVDKLHLIKRELDRHVDQFVPGASALERDFFQLFVVLGFDAYRHRDAAFFLWGNNKFIVH
jgi:hypothetical protein